MHKTLLMKRLLLLLSLATGLFASAQTPTNIVITDPLARMVVHGNYDPATFTPATPITNPDMIAQGINELVSADSLKAYIIKLSTFHNRNSGADTLSSATGIGAARRWVFAKFNEFSAASNNRLLPSYLQFDQDICSAAQHRNILAVLPGTDTSNHQVIIIEGHIDSRCGDVCDTNCLADGIEDNASGTALVIELARVMSQYAYKNTLVFMLTIAEEQGLYGANAMAVYATDNEIPVKAVLNNDVIGGVICGQTSSPPSCPGLNDIDSLQVRLFSSGGFNSRNKQLVRFIKLQYQEELVQHVAVPMTITVMSAEDRTGRGGDHIPFRQKGYPAMRFTSANEHGDASGGTGYTDRQHTSDDILGVDTDGNGSIDSFFVDFNYLARNACINGVGASMAAMGPPAPDFSLGGITGTGLIVDIYDPLQQDPQYRVAVRTLTNDWDTVFYTGQLIDTFFVDVAANYYVSVASVDVLGVESLFSREIRLDITDLGITEGEENEAPFELLQNKPNPFDEATIIGVSVNKVTDYKEATIVIRDVNGREAGRLPIVLESGINEVLYEHGYGRTGVYSYTLEIDGKVIATKTMIFAN